ncbi:multicopper oxidase domain-containing protein [Leucobacter denitrificans]|uniref:Copper-containing nitrite reductase n=2 Tax=Leucobacter denitrificans TaxID=683042 RepID=A0A7G9S7U4_9MICO|nr:multicopper oxidase domain-containing protein [Leucobacter denitrificans]
MRDLPTAVWLILTVVAVLFHRQIPMARWLMIHLLLLGAITHAILVWSQYFSFALLRSRATLRDRRTQNIRLVLANVGAVLVFVGVPTGVWALTVAGAAALVTAVGWHAVSLVRRARKSMPGKFGRTTRYYIASSGLLIVGASLGAIIAREATTALVLAHTLVNLLGWVGLTVAGTVVTLWPTMLRTRADEHAAGGAARALPALAIGVLVAAVGAAGMWIPILALGLALYVAGLVMIGVSLARAARRAAPYSFAALSVASALVWWFGCVVYALVGTVVALVQEAEFAGVATHIRSIAPYLAAGFAAQVLVGALSYLVPVVLGGGPTPVRVGTAAFDRLGVLRVATANSALAVCALPVSSITRVAASMLYLIAIASFLVIMVGAMRAQRRAKAAGARLEEPSRGPIVPEGEQPRGRRAGQAVAGLLAVVLTVVVSVAADPVGLQTGAAPTGDANAPVLVVEIEAADMRFTPDRVEVPVGTRLVIEVTNTDVEQSHDLVFENGITGGRLAPGESESLDVGVITTSLDGWCSIIGHRQMGMTFEVVAVDVSGNPVAGDEGNDASESGGGSEHAGHTSGEINLMADPGPDFTPFDAVLPALPPNTGPVTHELTLRAQDTLQEVAPGVTQTLWTFGETAPGPVLHGRVGDTFEITLVNDASIGHSIDFHAGALAPDEPMRTIAPGESLTYTFTATRSGIWMYHCSTMPMSAHIANGMYGGVVIEDPDLPPVDRSYVLVQGEYYLGDHDGGEVDVDKIAARNPDLVVFNGYANQYDHAPLDAVVGERVRVWVLDAGIERSSSFHVIGGQFDTVWAEGRYLINRVEGTGSQALGLFPAQGGFVELTFPEAGHYPFVSHFMIDAERGAHGIFKVTDPLGN